MDIQKEERQVKPLGYGKCDDESCDGKLHILEECVRCLRLFCPDHAAITPKGNACITCYPALYPEAMYAGNFNWLSHLH